MKEYLVDYGSDIEHALALLVEQIEASPEISEAYPVRWLSVALIDQDPGVDDRLGDVSHGQALMALRDQLLESLRDATGETVDTVIAGRRFDVVHEIATEVAGESDNLRLTRTDRIDSIVTNRYLGIPIFLAAMWMVFKITTDVAGAFLDWVDGAISGPISQLATALVQSVGLGGTWVESLLVNGVVAGVGAILVFVPVLISLYLALAFLEDTGYMARAAFVMDRLMRGVGLQGKSFLPMLVGFGCTVPAVYATRTLDNERDRILTSLLVPFMSCGARLPVYVLMSAVFFPQYAGLIVFSMYLLGIAVALVLGLILRATALPVTEYAPSIMEMPPYRMPTIRTIWFHTWVRTKAFLEEAGTIIFVTMLIVWLLMSIPASGAGTFAETDVDDSAFASVARVVAPIFEPAGFGTWEATGSLMSGFVAKEVVIGTMAQVYGVAVSDSADDPPSVIGSVKELIIGFGTATVDAVKAIPAIVGIDLGEGAEASESSALMSSIRFGFEESSGGHGGLAAIAYMVFVLLYTPCMAAVGAIRHEIGTKWMWASVVGQSLIAWLFAVAVFQGGLLVGLG
jgi:ferrous iron transport protein B